MFTVSQSKIATWRRCHYAYYLKHILHLRKKKKSRPLYFGSLVHDMVDADTNGDDPKAVLKRAQTALPKMFASERQEYLDTIDDARLIMADYFSMEWGKEELMPIRRGGKGAEHEFTIPLTKGIEVTGRLDLIAATPDKRRWLVERKSFGKSLPNEDHRWRNLQSNIYIRVGEILGIKFDGFAWDYIWSRPPPVPKLLKNGDVSQKRIKTLPTALREFFAREGIAPVARMLKNAEDDRKEYFIRIFSTIKQKTVDAVWNDFVETAKEVQQKAGVLKAKTVDRHCEWCDYESICRAEFTGGDVDFVKRREFEIREKQDKGEAIIDAS